MNDREAIIPKGMEVVYDQIHYAPAVRVGRTVYVSGQIGRDEQMRIVEGSEPQIVQTFENLRHVLEAAGASLADVVDLTSFHTDMRELKQCAEPLLKYRILFDGDCFLVTADRWPH
jgi:enamine deaminase RidA (YjgF/YER057c/UK114 family)